MSYYNCPDCDELPSEARAVRDLYDTMEHYRKLYYQVSKERDDLKIYLKQLRMREETP